MSAGVAYAEVSISGNARMGLQYNGGSAVVAGAIDADAVTAASALTAPVTLTAGATSAANIATLNAARVAAAALQTAADTAVANSIAATGASTTALDATAASTAAQVEAIDAIIASVSGAAAVDAATTFEKRMTVTMSGSVETTSGLTFGATMNLRANEGSAAVTTGARVHMATNGLEIAVGNINGAIEYMPGVYSASAGLTGLGWGGVLANTSATGYWNWDAYSSSGNGAEGVEVMYTAGSLSAHLSFSDSDLGSGADRTAGYVSYAMGDWTVAAGMQESTVAAEDKTLVTVGGKVGDFGVGFGWADNGGETKIALNGSATMGAVTISAYVADEESATDQPMGLGVAYDLGGAKVVGGVARTAAGVTRADAGVSFSF